MKEFYYRVVALFTMVIVFLSGGSYKIKRTPTDYQQCKNVIFMIGDGMGFNSIKLAEQESGKEFESFKSFPLQGESKTRSATYAFTDSAAGGTALATGVRTSLRAIGVAPEDMDAEESYPMSLTDLAISQGKSAGIVTTDFPFEATPASFSSHHRYRYDYNVSLSQQVSGGIQLIWGRRSNQVDYNIAADAGYEVVSEKEDFLNIKSGTFTYGRFPETIDKNDENVLGAPTLAEMTDKAIDLLDDNKNGFFLMIEEGYIDQKSDDKDAKGLSVAVTNFDSAIKVALDYAKKSGDTMVIVTADHETGGIKKLFNKYVYTTTEHTAANVPVYIYGCDNFIKNGEVVENREIARRTACVMGEKNFPIRVAVVK